MAHIAIYGGSFNPIHLGHTSLAESILQLGIFDEVWLMPTPLNPHKQDERTTIAPFHHRLTMAQLATRGVPSLRVTDYEALLPQPTYTSNTLAFLRRDYSQHRFSLLIGEDNWQSFPHWHNPQQIRDSHDIAVYSRTGNALLPASLTLYRSGEEQGEVLSSCLRTFPISSTVLRNAISQGDFPLLQRWLHPDVLSYIQHHRLYQL